LDTNILNLIEEIFNRITVNKWLTLVLFPVEIHILTILPLLALESFRIEEIITTIHLFTLACLLIEFKALSTLLCSACICFLIEPCAWSAAHKVNTFIRLLNIKLIVSANNLRG
jgi:hypothetical protein